MWLYLPAHRGGLVQLRVFGPPAACTAARQQCGHRLPRTHANLDDHAFLHASPLAAVRLRSSDPTDSAEASHAKWDASDYVWDPYTCQAAPSRRSERNGNRAGPIGCGPRKGAPACQVRQGACARMRAASGIATASRRDNARGCAHWQHQQPFCLEVPCLRLSTALQCSRYCAVEHSGHSRRSLRPRPCTAAWLHHTPGAPSPSAPAQTPCITCAHIPVQVDGCTTDLMQLKDYHQRYRICEEHLKVGVERGGGQPAWWPGRRRLQEWEGSGCAN